MRTRSQMDKEMASQNGWKRGSIIQPLPQLRKTQADRMVDDLFAFLGKTRPSDEEQHHEEVAAN